MIIPVFRVKKEKNYTSMCNYHLLSKELSLKAIGLLSKILALPDDWDYSFDGLVNICQDGKDSVRSALNDLKEHGYIIIKQVRDKGRIDYEYEVYEVPITVYGKTVDGKTADGKPQTVSPLTVNPPQLNTNILNTNNKVLNTKSLNNKKAYRLYVEGYTSNESLRDALMSWVEMRIVDKRPFTHRALELALQKLDRLADDDETKIEIINESVSRGWLSFFELKKSNKMTDEELLKWAEEEDRKLELERNHGTNHSD